jgi:hypothetical protein
MCLVHLFQSRLILLVFLFFKFRSNFKNTIVTEIVAMIEKKILPEEPISMSGGEFLHLVATVLVLRESSTRPEAL